MPAVSSEPVPREALLSGLSHELALMVPLVEGLSGLVMDHAVQADAADRPRILVQAQAVDDLGQRLQALVQLTQAVAKGAAPDTAVDDVPLTALATRLRSALRGDPGTPAPAATSTGDLTLFEP